MAPVNFRVPAWVESLFILEDLARLQLLFIHCLPLCCERAPVFLALKTQMKSSHMGILVNMICMHVW